MMITEEHPHEDIIVEESLPRPRALAGLLVLIAAGFFAAFSSVPAASWICLGIVGVLFVLQSRDQSLR